MYSSHSGTLTAHTRTHATYRNTQHVTCRMAHVRVHTYHEHSHTHSCNRAHGQTRRRALTLTHTHTIVREGVRGGLEDGRTVDLGQHRPGGGGDGGGRWRPSLPIPRDTAYCIPQHTQTHTSAGDHPPPPRAAAAAELCVVTSGVPETGTD